MQNIISSSGIHLQHLANCKATAALWMIPGFTETPAVLHSIQTIAMAAKLNLYWITLPGFGSPMMPELDRQLIPALTQTLEQYSNGSPIMLLGHSLGGTIATKLIPTMPTDQAQLFLNCDGMLVEDTAGTARSLSAASQYQNAEAFKAMIIEKYEQIISQLKTESNNKRILMRYLNNIQKWPATTLHQWSLYSNLILKDNTIAKQYQQLSCASYFIRGEHSMAYLEQQYIENKNIDSISIAGSGHWPMLDNKQAFLKVINRCIEHHLK